MKRKLLFMAVAHILCTTTAVSQTQPTVMELTDYYGDKQQVELVDGTTVYLPQSYYYYENACLVLCKADGTPYFQFPMYMLGSIRYLADEPNYFRPPYDLSAYREPAEYAYGQTLRWMVEGREYKFPRLGEWTVTAKDGPLMQQLLTADGQRFSIPVSVTQRIELRDTIVGVGGYLLRMLADEANVYRWAYFNGQTSATDYMGENFYAKIPDVAGHNFSLIVPTDEALSHYVDIPSFPSQQPRVLRFSYQEKNFPVKYNMYAYDAATAEVGRSYNMEQISNSEITNRLAMMLRSHTILHEREEDKSQGLQSGNEYYVTLDGNVVRVLKDAAGQPVALQGAFQMQNAEKGLTQATITDQNNGAFEKPWSLTQANITKRRQKGNGWIYMVDGVLDASPQSAYSVLSAGGAQSADNPYGRFLELCQSKSSLLLACGVVDANTSQSMQGTLMSKYQIFTAKNGMDYNLNFVGNCPFTLYVPTNAAIEAEMAKGNLPTWEEIEADYEACARDDRGYLANADDSLRLQRKCLTLVNFVKAHIQFGMEIADQLPFEREHNTAVVTERLTTPRLTVRGLGQGRMTVTDETGQTRNVLDGRKNVFVRDLSCSQSPVGRITMNGITIDNYTVGVIHQIDGVLSYQP